MFRIPSPQLLNSLEDDFMSSFFGAMERDHVNLDWYKPYKHNKPEDGGLGYASFGRRAGLAVLTDTITRRLHSLPTPTGAYEIGTRDDVVVV
jgi:hypothetical protein